MTRRSSTPARRLTHKQRVQRRYRKAYCKRHFDCDGLWCVFLRRDDDMALVCASTVAKAWRGAFAHVCL